MPEIISVHDVWEPCKQVLLASRDVIIPSQFAARIRRGFFTLGDGCWLPTLVSSPKTAHIGRNQSSDAGALVCSAPPREFQPLLSLSNSEAATVLSERYRKCQGKYKRATTKGQNRFRIFHTFRHFFTLFHNFSPRTFPFKTKGFSSRRIKEKKR